MAALVDTNVLFYRFDPRYPEKQEIAAEVLERGISDDSLRVPHQAVLELVAVLHRPLLDGEPLLPPERARREAEELLDQFVILYPDEHVVRIALRGMAAYTMSWYDAHLWAYAEHYGLAVLLSEDFQHGRMYGSVRVVNPFHEGTS